MYKPGPFDFVPLWLMVAVTLIAVYGAVESGYRLGERRRRNAEHEAEAPVGAIVGATLGLLAFMLAFTFSLAASRFEDRRQVVLDEANAIGTTYLRAGMLAEPHRGEIRKLLREYVEMRIRAIQDGNIDEGLKMSNEYHERIWAAAEAVVKEDRSPIAASFVVSLNEVIDLHASRIQAGLRSRIPLVIWLALAFVTMVAMLAMGYQMGLASKKRSAASLSLVLTFSAVLLLIADLDRPGEGLLEVGQQATIDLLDSMKDAN
ncbi:MAG: hypothetical protein DCC68_23575 [Planctomycetota bacterium]|nr:MAG: hypothetical protein DCC68_23575 [Planctomycetota bacterium]